MKKCEKRMKICNKKLFENFVRKKIIRLIKRENVNTPPPKNIVGIRHDRISFIQTPIFSGTKFEPPNGSPVMESAPH